MKATDELRAAWEAWQRRPLPRVADDEELDELRDELAEHDARVAAAVTAGQGATAALPDADLRARIVARLDDPDPVTASDARDLLVYLDDLEALLALARRTHEQTRPMRSRR